MKIPGLIAVISAFFAIGISRLKQEKEKMKCVDNLISGISVLRAELLARLCPLSDLFRMAASATEGESSVFFQEAADMLDEPGDAKFSEKWSGLCRNELPNLSSPLRSELEKLGHILGQFEIEDQLASCDKTILALDSYRKESAKKYPEQRQLTLTVCGSAACFLCLLIL